MFIWYAQVLEHLKHQYKSNEWSASFWDMLTLWERFVKRSIWYLYQSKSKHNTLNRLVTILLRWYSTVLRMLKYLPEFWNLWFLVMWLNSCTCDIMIHKKAIMVCCLFKYEGSVSFVCETSPTSHYTTGRVLTKPFWSTLRLVIK